LRFDHTGPSRADSLFERAQLDQQTTVVNGHDRQFGSAQLQHATLDNSMASAFFRLGLGPSLFSCLQGLSEFLEQS
jgi:hypothetical protein